MLHGKTTNGCHASKAWHLVWRKSYTDPINRTYTGQVPPCSIRTMYRVLAANAEVRERRNQLRHPAYRKPELLATGPNQVWSWDIIKLQGPVKWTYYYLYVLLDIFSRYVVGWLLGRQESAALAKVLIAES